MISHEELGRRLKAAREALGFTQDRAAEDLGLSRVAISQIESGKRTVSSIELVKLARLYGRDIATFLSDQPFVAEKDALSALFRANPHLAEDEKFSQTIRDAAELCREYANLKRLLELDTEFSTPFAYLYPDPGTVWEAIQMGEQVAEQERSRLNLGIDPVKDMAEIVEPQGIPVIKVDLNPDISGIFFANGGIGPCIFVNQTHVQYARARVAFTIAHEYGHILLDRNQISRISKANSRDLLEVRANAFAAAFLMPKEGVRQFLRSLGKGEESREKLVAHAGEEAPAVGQYRRLASSQTLTFYDVLQLHHHFGISFEAALYRLRNLKVLSEEEFNALYQRKDEARQAASKLRLADEKNSVVGRFDLNFLGMAIEAYRREEITYAKLLELAKLVQFLPETVSQLLEYIGIKEELEGIKVP